MKTGIAKLNDDWLRAMPLRSWLRWREAFPIFGPILAHPLTAWFFSYGGTCIFKFSGHCLCNILLGDIWFCGHFVTEDKIEGTLCVCVLWERRGEKRGGLVAVSYI